MREIKFRARFRARIANVPRCWIYGYFAVIKGECFIFNEDDKFPVISGTECQYTGLKDKNGKEIYEGDILEYVGSTCPHCGHYYKYEGHDLYVITWQEEDCTFECWERGKVRDGNYIDRRAWGECLEVVGNVYENPELLEKIK